VALFWAQFPRGGEASRRPLGFGKGSDRGGLGISRAARRASRPLRCGLRLPVEVGADVANGRVGKEAPSGGRWSTLQARAIAPPHGGISRRRATGRDCGHCARTEETRTGSVGG
jgi:hypothetical protein